MYVGIGIGVCMYVGIGIGVVYVCGHWYRCGVCMWALV